MILNSKITKHIIVFITLLFLIPHFTMPSISKEQSCLFRNPLCFYANDIVTYLQVLYKQGLYDRMLPFLYTPQDLKKNKKQALIHDCESMNFGYEMKRVGIREVTKNKEWILTYQRVILGTSETFSVQCALINDSVRITSSKKDRARIFSPKTR